MQTNLKFKKWKRNVFLIIILFISISAIYINTFKDVEQVCHNKKNIEIYLLNYVTKKNLKEIVTKHNQEFQLKDQDLKRVYLLHPILRIQDPIFHSNINYRKNGCQKIDNMDIYCEVRYTKLSDDTIDIWYNFME